ncbi:MAG: SpoIVB peptidase S55 domain-containing protein [Acidobacteriota bacterium]|nr:SpoIVB peptidase S55 domain-containing protein [Acidobacteriota bacterium]
MVLALLATSLGGSAPAATTTSLPADILPLSAVRTGMKGYGLTVLHGSLVERFDVEVLGIVPNNLGRSQIIVRVSGLGLEKTGILAGMSGSPVYFEGRLAGAVAATWGFAKEPVGSVTPIESMLAIDGGEGEKGPDAGAQTGRIARLTASPSGFAEFAAALTLPEDERLLALRRIVEARPGWPVHASPSLLAPVSTGFPADTLGRFSDDLSRLGIPLASGTLPALPGTALQAAERARPAAPLAAGSALTALLIDGDLQLGATGTVTRVDEKGRFLAFGHPFLGAGRIELPAAPAEVVTVFPSAMLSFKMAYALAPLYRLTHDRDSGVAGRTDRTVPLVPVRFRLESDGGSVRTLSWGIARETALLPMLLSISLDAALTTLDTTPIDRTLHLRVAVDTKTGPFVYADQMTGPRAKELALMTANVLTGLVAQNDYEEPGITGVDVSIVSAPGEKRLRIVEAALSTRKAAPGETLHVTVRLADRRGAEQTRVLFLTLPKETPEGRAIVLVGDGNAASGARLAAQPSEPRNLAGLRDAIGRLVPGDRLAALLLVPARGATTGDATLTALPPSFAMLLSEGSEGNPRPSVPSRILAEEIVVLDRPASGSVRLEVEVERPRS